MSLRENIDRLVRYCGQYQAHGFMMDERNTDMGFNVELPEEREIRDRIGELRVILFTGEAGDGKSRIIRNLKGLLSENHFTDPCMDFSALAEEEKKALIKTLRQTVDGVREEKLVICANVGVFTQAVLRYDMSLMKELTGGRRDVHNCNFEKRNLAEDEEVFGEIVRVFLTGGKGIDECLSCTEEACPCREDCQYRVNIEKLLSESGTGALRTICDTIYLTGGHITFRELLSMLSYTVTFGQDCRERQKYVEAGGSLEKVAYYNIFEKSGDMLLSKVSKMDPALKKGKHPPDVCTGEQYVPYRRKRFFDAGQDRYTMLNVDYLTEFVDVLEYMDKAPYNYDVVRDRHPVLVRLKKGINKMSSQGRSDAGLVVTDTPLILGSKIRLEFQVMQNVGMVWHRYDVGAAKGSISASRRWNKFYLSYVGRREEGKGRKLISLLIDYQQFRYLMMCSDDFFMNRSELTVEEYAVNTFYRKILREREQAYDAVLIRFDDREDCCDFSLTVHDSEDIFSDANDQTILIRRES